MEGGSKEAGTLILFAVDVAWEKIAWTNMHAVVNVGSTLGFRCTSNSNELDVVFFGTIY